MPWKVTDVLDERTRFVLEYESGSFTMAELCRIYGIARKTGYVWTDRYEVEGLAGLQDRVYGAGHHPNQTKSGIEEQIVQLKQAHPSWGSQEAASPSFGDEKGCPLACGEHFWRDLAAGRVERTASQASEDACVRQAV